MADHRVSLHGLSLRRYDDPVTSRDPRIRAVVAGLQTLDVAPAPRAHFRAELRAQLVAVAPRLIADGISAEGKMIDIVPRPTPAPDAAPEVSRRARRGTGRRSIPIARPLAVAATLITVFALLLGGAVYLSRNALPGDTLYGLKRAKENLELSLAGSNQDRANLLLDFAGTRVDEAQGLLDRTTASAAGVSAGGLNDETAQLIDSNLASADGDVRDAAQLLGGDAVRSDNPKPLATMTAWAPGQLARLHHLAKAMPPGVLKARTSRSTKLVHRAVHRAKTLQTKVHCGALDTSGTDELGPLPVRGCAGGTSNQGTKPTKHRHHHRHNGGGPAPNSGPVAPPSLGTGQPQPGNHHGQSGSPTKTGTSHTAKPPVTLPTLPLPSLPISPGLTLTNCDLGLGLGIVQIDLDTCLLLGGTPHN